MRRTKEMFIYFYLLFISFGNRRARCACHCVRIHTQSVIFWHIYLFPYMHCVCARANTSAFIICFRFDFFAAHRMSDFEAWPNVRTPCVEMYVWWIQYSHVRKITTIFDLFVSVDFAMFFFFAVYFSILFALVQTYLSICNGRKNRKRTASGTVAGAADDVEPFVDGWFFFGRFGLQFLLLLQSIFPLVCFWQIPIGYQWPQKNAYVVLCCRSMKHCGRHHGHNSLKYSLFFTHFFHDRISQKNMDLCIEWRLFKRRRDLINLRIGAWIRSICKTIVCRKVGGGMNYHYMFSMLIVLNGERHNELTYIDRANTFSDCTVAHGCIRWQPNRWKHQNTLISSGARSMKCVAMRSDVFRFTKIIIKYNKIIISHFATVLSVTFEWSGARFHFVPVPYSHHIAW